MSTPEIVAKWMLDEIDRDGMLYQEMAVYGILEKMGEEFIYYNANGNPAIASSVLKIFRKLSEDTVVWERGQRLWRKREPYDETGRQQH